MRVFQRTNTQPSKAFSLFELVMVLAIITILGAIAVPRYANATANYRAEAASRRIIADLELARRKARASRQSRTVEFQILTNRVRILDVADMADSSKTYITKLADDPYRAELISADLGGDAEVTFDGYGMPDSGGTIVVRHAGIEETIVLDAYSGKAEPK